LNDVAVADFFDEQVDAGRRPDQFARIWIHTHPGSSASPSHVDEQTFGRVFGPCGWAVMFILACHGETYARLRLNVGPGGSLVIPVEVDYRRAFTGSDMETWTAEYDANVFIDSVFWPGDLEALADADVPRLLPELDHIVNPGQRFASVNSPSAEQTDSDGSDVLEKVVPAS